MAKPGSAKSPEDCGYGTGHPMARLDQWPVILLVYFIFWLWVHEINERSLISVAFQF
jgi:hypothetical protein